MHKLCETAPGKKVFYLGNEAVARGAIEAGVACATTYPGTPSSEISLSLFQVSKETDLYFEYSVNEKVAMEVAAAAANAGVRSFCMMKHVGMNVAADVLMTLSYIGVKAGMVILTADDPFMFSSQNEQDNRYYGKLAGLPILEPSTPQEAKDMMISGMDLSEKLGVPVILRTTTRVNHSTAEVVLGEIRPRVTEGSFTKNPFMMVAIPAVSRRLHTRLLARLAEAEKLANESPANFIEGTGPWGIAVNGVSYNYVKDAITDLGIGDKVSVFRMGFSNPAPKLKITDFLKGKDQVLVAEEGEPFMEEMIKAVAQENGVVIPIKGKADGLFSREGEFDPAMVRAVMAKFFGVADTPPARIDQAGIPEIPARPPNLCAGCPHRATFYEVHQAAGDRATIFPTDIGCYTLGVLPPLSAADFLICMGSSAGTSAGFSKFTKNKTIAFIGDSTFFHSGIGGLVNAVFNNHNFTLVIVDNGTTAMTGHQPHPGVDMVEMGFSGYNRVSIEDVVRGLGVKTVVVTDPYKVKKSVEAIKEALDAPGVSVVISRQICPLYARSVKRPRRGPFMVTDKCKNHRTCVDKLGCPAMFVENGKVEINPQQCTGCAVCAQVCPENAILPAKG